MLAINTWRAHFRTNRSCRVAPAHQDMKSRSDTWERRVAEYCFENWYRTLSWIGVRDMVSGR